MIGAVEIRAYEVGDGEALYEAVRESIWEVSPWMAWCGKDYGLADARGWIEMTLRGRREGTLYDFAIVVDGVLAGGCGLNQINLLDRVANLGYWVRSSMTGRGIAPVAVEHVLAWGFGNTNLNRIEIVVAVDNARSRRVAEKVGARRDAVLAQRTMVRGAPSDAILYSVVRGDSGWVGARG